MLKQCVIVDSPMPNRYRVTMAKGDKTETVKFRCEKEVKAALVNLAREKERSLSAQILYILKKSIGDYQSGD